MSESLQNRIDLLEDTVSDLKDALDLTQQEHRNELDELRAKVEAMESYRQEQLARAIAQHQVETLSALLEIARKRHAAAQGSVL